MKLNIVMTITNKRIKQVEIPVEYSAIFTGRLVPGPEKYYIYIYKRNEVHNQ